MNDTLPQAIFLLSLPRSGSTLCQRILTAHPEIASANEPHILLPVLYGINEHDVRSTYSHQYTAWAVQDFSDGLIHGRDDYYAEVRHFALRLYQKSMRNSARYFLDKTPKYHFIVDDLFQVFPNGKFIFMWRNPLAIIASLISTWGAGRWNIFHFYVDFYQGLPDLIASYQKYLQCSIAFSYEKLLLSPDFVLQQIFEYLELSYDPKLLTDFANIKLKGRVRDPNSSLAEYQTLTTQPINKWKQVFSNPLRKAWGRKYLHWLGEDRLELMGYSLNDLLAELKEIPNQGNHLLDDMIRIPLGSGYHLFELQLLKQKVHALLEESALTCTIDTLLTYIIVEMNNSISIIIPTYNRMDSLKIVLESLSHQLETGIPVEVIVVSDGSTDGTQEFLSNKQFRYPLLALFQENQGVAAARNLGIQRATCDLVLFLDDDVVPTPQFLQEHLAYHQLYGPQAIVIGPMSTPLDIKLAPWVQWEQDKLAQQYKAMIAGEWKPTARQFYTGNVSLARAHLLEAGGFDPAFRRAEDVELAYRLAAKGLKFYFNPDAVGYHYAVRSFDSWLSTPYSYGSNDVVFSEKKGQIWLLPLIFEEYQKKRLISRFVVYICLDNPKLSKAIKFFLKTTITIGGLFNFPFVCNAACSILFHLNYYQGISDGLGGRRAFYSWVMQARKTLAHPNLP